ncbi:hypothetical protein Tco_1143842 [Tanacetum coccineum]
MSTPEYIYPIIILSDSDVEYTFSSTHSPDYIMALSDYSLASPGNTSPNFSDDITKDLLSSLSILPFHDDLRILKFSVISSNVITRKHTRIYTMSNDFNTTRVAQQKRGRPITHRFHKLKYSIHPGSDKIYQDLEKFYWLSSRGVVLKISRRVKGGVSDLYLYRQMSPSLLYILSLNYCGSMISLLPDSASELDQGISRQLGALGTTTSLVHLVIVGDFVPSL